MDKSGLHLLCTACDLRDNETIRYHQCQHPSLRVIIDCTEIKYLNPEAILISNKVKLTDRVWRKDPFSRQITVLKETIL